MIQAMINITVIEGENNSLTCHVSGTPDMPSVSWTEVTTGDRTEGNSIEVPAFQGYQNLMLCCSCVFPCS